MSKAEIAKLPPLTIARQSGPPPRHMEVVDLRKGSGAVVTKRTPVEVHWFQVNYPEVQKRSRSGLYGPQTFPLDNVVKGWAVGLPGMRVGGRRELILPPKLVYPRWEPSWGYAPYVRIYVVDLLGVKAPS
jgi:peptidylprolyl isomerase